MATATQEVTGLQTLPLAKIKASPMNPRKTFDQAALTELADSIESTGVHQPILVRPDGNTENFEIVVGERRYRAAKMAGLKEIPVIVRPMSNAEALEVMVIENLQREDVHPMEEAAGYQALLNKLDTCSECKSNVRRGHRLDCPRRNEVVREHTVDSLAAKVGKSTSYIYQRLKLATLIQFAAAVFREGHITAGHAILIARLQPQDQERALRACFDEHGYHSKLPIGELMKESLDEYGSGLMAEKDLRIWIQENVNLSLKHAAWELDDAELVPEAGACSVCPKRSGTNPALFADMVDPKVKDVCTDPECFKKKQHAVVQLKAEQLAEKDKPSVKISEKHSYNKPKEGAKLLRKGQWVPAKQGECEAVATGILVDGEAAGTTKTVCTNPSCKKHKHNLQSGIRSGGSYAGYDPQEANELRKKREEQEARDHKFRMAVFSAILPKITKLGDVEMRSIAHQSRNVMAFGDSMQGLLGVSTDKALREKIAKAKGPELPRLVFTLAMNDVIDPWGDDRQPLIALAQAYKVDLKKIEKQFAEKPAPPQTSAKAKKAVKKRGRK